MWSVSSEDPFWQLIQTGSPPNIFLLFKLTVVGTRFMITFHAKTEIFGGMKTSHNPHIQTLLSSFLLYCSYTLLTFKTPLLLCSQISSSPVCSSIGISCICSEIIGNACLISSRISHAPFTIKLQTLQFLENWRHYGMGTTEERFLPSSQLSFHSEHCEFLPRIQFTSMVIHCNPSFIPFYKEKPPDCDDSIPRL